MADERKEAMDALMKEIADVKAKLASQQAPMGAEEIEKRAAAIAEKQFKAREAEMIAALRKGSFSEREDESAPQHELLLEKSERAAVKDLQRFNDDVLILSKALNCHPTQTKLWQKNAAKYSELRKAMDSSTSGSGAEWVPTNFSADLVDRFRLARKVANLFNEINMPTDPYKLPALTGDITAYKVSEVTSADPSTKSFTASSPTSAVKTLDAVKMGARVQWSTELQEDSIIPVLELYKNQLAIAMATGHENVLLNGDTTATHMDADVTASTDVRKLFKGLRKMTQTANDQSLATFSNSTLRSLRGKMGKYGAYADQLVFIVSAKVYLKMLDLPDLITKDKYGDQATVLSGEVSKIDGIPVVISELMRDDVNASGVNDATTNAKGLVLLVKPSAFISGRKRGVTVKFFEDSQNDIQFLTASWRGDFKCLYDEATEAVAVKGVNIAI